MCLEQRLSVVLKQCLKTIWKEEVSLSQKILLFLQWDLQISGREEKCVFSGMGYQTNACLSFTWFSLFDISFLTLPDLVIGLLLTFFTQWRREQSCWVLTSLSCSKMTFQSLRVPLVSDLSVCICWRDLWVWDDWVCSLAVGTADVWEHGLPLPSCFPLDPL